jgi:hypothetical protein
LIVGEVQEGIGVGDVVISQDLMKGGSLSSQAGLQICQRVSGIRSSSGEAIKGSVAGCKQSEVGQVVQVFRIQRVPSLLQDRIVEELDKVFQSEVGEREFVEGVQDSVAGFDSSSIKEDIVIEEGRSVTEGEVDRSRRVV